MSDPVPLGHLVAALGARADVVSMTQVLTATLAELLPSGVVQVDRRRSIGDRISGRAGTPVSLTVLAGQRRLCLRALPGGGTEPEIEHVVRGVTISRRTVPIAEWVRELATELARTAAADEQARAVLDRLLLG